MLIGVVCCVYIGNFMYFSATSKYMILGSRFIVGECGKCSIRYQIGYMHELTILISVEGNLNRAHMYM